MFVASIVMFSACGARHGGDVAPSFAVASEEGIEGGVLGAAVRDEYGPSGARKFHHSELKVKRRVYPSYPIAARKLGLGNHRCIVTVVMDEHGVPTDVQVDNCPEVFWPGTRAAMMQWRWRAPTFEGQPVRAQTTIVVTYIKR